jgi:hypothetical protein
MLRRAADRHAAGAAWSVGTDWADETVSSVEVRVHPDALPVPNVETTGDPRTRPFDDIALPPGLSWARAATWARAADAHDRAVDEARDTESRAQANADAMRREADAIEANAATDRSTALTRVSRARERAEQMRRAWFVGAGPGAAVLAAVAGVAGASLVVPISLVLIGLAAVAGGRATHARRVEALRRETEQVETTAARQQEAARALRARADELESTANDDADGRRDAARQQLADARAVVEAPVDDMTTARFYGELLLDAFCRWDVTHNDAICGAVRVARRSDGALVLELRGVSADFTRTWTRAWRELCGPLADPRYILHCPTVGLAATVSSALNAQPDVVTTDGGAVLAVPDPLASHRAGADAMAAAWRAAAGPCRVLYTRRGEGAELLARNLSRRPLDMRTSSRTVWR